jgi:hypothetical protein
MKIGKLYKVRKYEPKLDCGIILLPQVGKRERYSRRYGLNLTEEHDYIFDHDNVALYLGLEIINRPWKLYLSKMVDKNGQLFYFNIGSSRPSIKMHFYRAFDEIDTEQTTEQSVALSKRKIKKRRKKV